MKVRSGFLLMCSLLVSIVGISKPTYAHAETHEFLASNSSLQGGGQESGASSPALVNAQSEPGNPSSGSGTQPRTWVVQRFTVYSQPVQGSAVASAQACSQVSTAASSSGKAISLESVTVDPKVLDQITSEFQKQISKKMPVMVNPDLRSVPAGSLVISGCVTRAISGDAAERLIGLNLGVSRLWAHVVVRSRTRDGWNPVDTFDIQVKGGSILPPLPLMIAVHAVRDVHKNLSVDAKTLADKSLKRLAEDMKAEKQVAETSYY